MMMAMMWLKTKELVRGNLSLPAVVFVWTGLWNSMDIDVPGGTGLWKELALAVVGSLVMLWTNTFFSNAGMDAWEANGIIMRLRAVMHEKRISERDKLLLYALSLGAMAGSIIFWDGVYTIFEQHVWDNSLRYHLVCIALGGVGVVWVMTSEEEHGAAGDCNGDGDSKEEVGSEEAKMNAVDATVRMSADIESGNDNGNGSVRNEQAGAWRMTNSTATAETRLETRQARVTADIAMLPLLEKIALYAKGFLGNICGVVFWYGLEHVITDQSPDTVWTGLVSYAAGIMLLMLIWRWKENCGMDSDEERNKHDVMTSMATGATEHDPGELNKAVTLVVGPQLDEPRFCWPPWVTTTLEIAGVVAAWTGVEWYIWDDNYIPRTLYRDPLYIVVGLAVLAVTGTFLELSGTPLGGVARRKTETVSMSVLFRRFSSTILGDSLRGSGKEQQSRNSVESTPDAIPIETRRYPQRFIVYVEEVWKHGETKER